MMRLGGIVVAIASAAAIAAPFFLKPYGIFLISTWAVLTIAAIGLNLTLGYAGQIERYNQPVFRRDPGRLHVTSHHALGNVDQLPHQRFQRLDIGRMFQALHLVIGFVRK